MGKNILRVKNFTAGKIIKGQGEKFRLQKNKEKRSSKICGISMQKSREGGKFKIRPGRQTS